MKYSARTGAVYHIENWFLSPVLMINILNLFPALSG